MSFKKFSNSIIAAVVFTLIIPLIYSGTLGKIRIKVKDSKGNALSGVSITLVSQRTKTFVFKIKTKKSGIAVQVGLQNHVFLVTVEKEGYRTLKKKVKIPAGLMQKEEFTLISNEEAQEKQIANDPRSQAVNAYNQAVFHIKEKQYDDALVNFKKALQLDAGLNQAHFYIGVALYEKKQYKEAEAPLLKALSLNEEGSAQLYRMLAAVYEKLGKKEETQKYTKLAQEKGGKTAIDAYNEGIFAFNAGQTDKAIAAFEESIKLDANLGDSYYRLGLCYLNNSANDKAIAALKKYIELKPDGKEVETAKAIMDSLK